MIRLDNFIEKLDKNNAIKLYLLFDEKTDKCLYMGHNPPDCFLNRHIHRYDCSYKYKDNGFEFFIYLD